MGEQPPQHIRSDSTRHVLELQWSDNPTDLCALPFRMLREQCPCASCIDEFTGKRILDVTTIPDDIRPVSMSLTGNYALRIVWSDQHASGLYTWVRLGQLCRMIEQSPN